MKNNSKQTNSYEKIEALQERIENTEQHLQESSRMQASVPDAEQRGAIEAKNNRRQQAIADAKKRIDEEHQDMKDK